MPKTNAGPSEYEAGELLIRLNSLRIVHYMEQKALTLIRLETNWIFLFFLQYDRTVYGSHVIGDG